MLVCVSMLILLFLFRFGGFTEKSLVIGFAFEETPCSILRLSFGVWFEDAGHGGCKPVALHLHSVPVERIMPGCSIVTYSLLTNCIRYWSKLCIPSLNEASMCPVSRRRSFRAMASWVPALRFIISKQGIRLSKELGIRRWQMMAFRLRANRALALAC